MLLQLLVALAGAASAVAFVEPRDVTPIGNEYTPLGCANWTDDRESQSPRDNPDTLLNTITECMRGSGSLRPYLVAMTNLDQDGKGLCWQYRDPGPGFATLSSFPQTADGWCATDQGLTLITPTKYSFVGCYDKMWWYKGSYRPGWGKFKPMAVQARTPPVVNHTAYEDLGEYVLPHHNLQRCTRTCQQAQYEFPHAAVALTPQGECICTDGDVAHDKPVECTATTWRFYWSGEGEMPRGANNYKKGKNKQEVWNHLGTLDL